MTQKKWFQEGIGTHYNVVSHCTYVLVQSSHNARRLGSAHDLIVGRKLILYLPQLNIN